MSESDRTPQTPGEPLRHRPEGDPLIARLEAALSGRYAIEGEVGRGGMGVVFLARDLKHGRRVAMKVLPPALAYSLGAERFLREIRTTARLTHPHILSLHDSGEADGLLFFVMPYVEGESLEERLAREGPLPIGEASRIACEVADALAEAHSFGVVHRDIKPGNILLSGGRHVCVADFGLSRAVFNASNRKLTASGATIGSPVYMSPEQIDDPENVDARSDLYSLGCVLYEMLTGRPPFDGGSVQSVLSRHLLERPPPLRSLRPDVPPPVIGIVRRLLAKAPGERYRSAADLRADLRDAGAEGAGDHGTRNPDSAPEARRRSGEPHGNRRSRGSTGGAGVRKQVAMGAAGILALAALAVLANRVPLPSGEAHPAPAAAVDSSLYAIVPFRGELQDAVAAAPSTLRENLLLYDALSYWEGINVVDPLVMESVLQQHGSAELSPVQARQIAQDLGAGLYIWGSVYRRPEGHRVRAALYDTSSGRRIREAIIEVAVPQHADSVFARLADSLLFEHGGHVDAFPGRWATRSRAALQNYIHARGALRQWDLEAADSLLEQATDADSEFALAHLWLAHARIWAGLPPGTWTRSGERAWGGRDRMPARDSLLATALGHLARGEFSAACEWYDLLLERDSQDFAGWFGRGECRRLDDAVVHDSNSPSGYAFRSSAHQAVQSYMRAFSLLPGAHRWLRSERYGWVRELLYTSPQQLRSGRLNRTEFLAYPGWEGDTLSFVPRERSAFSAGDPETVPPSILDAVRGQRERFHELARSWVRAFPESPDALEGLSLSLEMLADPEAIDMARRARRVAGSDARRAEIAASEVWLLVRFGVPDRIDRVRNAVALGDSLLSGLVGDSTVSSAASVAALLGRADDAARLARDSPPIMAGLPGRIHAPAAALLTYAAFGFPADSIRTLAVEVDDLIRNALTSSEQTRARQTILGRAKVLSLPAGQEEAFATFDIASSYYLAAAAQSHLVGDTVEVLSILEGVREIRAVTGPLSISLDALYPEAWLLYTIGEQRAATAWLDAALEELPWLPLNANREPAAAAALLRSMQLRVDLAERSGDSVSASRWTEPLHVLWPDPESPR